jgi:hypothetical protein
VIRPDPSGDPIADSDPQFQQQLIAAGFDLPVDASPVRMRHSRIEEIARWRPVIRAIGLKLD